MRPNVSRGEIDFERFEGAEACPASVGSDQKQGEGQVCDASQDDRANGGENDLVKLK